jgi:hypothetical protein
MTVMSIPEADSPLSHFPAREPASFKTFFSYQDPSHWTTAAILSADMRIVEELKDVMPEEKYNDLQDKVLRSLQEQVPRHIAGR